MIARLTLPFSSSKGLKYNFFASSVLQGVMMQSINSDYAGLLHTQSLRPYSQFCTNQNGQNFWIISTLSQEACENIIRPLSELSSAFVRNKNDSITFGSPDIEVLSYSRLLEEGAVGNGRKSDRITMNFITPTAFKSSGAYVILPSLRLIFLSIAKRFDFFCGIIGNDYDEFASDIEQLVTVSDYKLQSATFSLEGVHLPSFSGSITLNVRGDDQFRSYIRMLCRYARFSGIGIKTAIGMGQVTTDIS